MPDWEDSSADICVIVLCGHHHSYRKAVEHTVDKAAVNIPAVELAASCCLITLQTSGSLFTFFFLKWLPVVCVAVMLFLTTHGLDFEPFQPFKICSNCVFVELNRQKKSIAFVLA